jgi:rRNA-processing protein FCF1
MLPKRDVPAKRAVTMLTDVIGHGSRLQRSEDLTPYVAWVQNVERVLRECFVDVPLSKLYTERFWNIQHPVGPINTRLQMVVQENDVQLEWLTVLRDTVVAMAARFSEPQRSISVLDTNVLLHHKPLSDVQWSRVVGDERVLLVLPRKVVEELDAKKYTGEAKLRDRARTRARLLARCLERKTDQARRGVDVEIVASVDLDPDAARRPPIPVDEEVIETCEALMSYARSNPVYLVTGDQNMQTLAQSRDVDVRRMPEDTEQPLGSE